jgi:type II secretory pathway pseudopilin PulG
MRHPLRSTPAESLIETIIAITVIILGTAAALSMLRTTLDGNELVGKKEVAINLALEGLDALRNIRDTNYLRFPLDADTCWNTFGGTTASCADGTVLLNGYTYFYGRDFSGTTALDWDLTRVASASNGYLTLYGVDLDGDRVSDMDLYAQSGLVPADGFITQEQRAFRRTVTVSYNATDSYDATVTVTWDERGATHSISLTRTIAHVY